MLFVKQSAHGPARDRARLADGETVAKARLDSGPERVTLDGRRVHVEAYGHVYDLELR